MIPTKIPTIIPLRQFSIIGIFTSPLSNHITEEAKKVESTKIGVKTCRKICQDMGGDFLVTDRDKIYTTEVIFPVVGTEEEGNVDKGYSENQRNA